MKFLCGLAEDRDPRPMEAWPRDDHRYAAWFNALNEAYVKARYCWQFDISNEALRWLTDRTHIVHDLVHTLCQERLAELEHAAGTAGRIVKWRH